MTTTVLAPSVAPADNDDGVSNIRHAYCTWCSPARVVAEQGATAACGYRRPPGPVLPDDAPTCVVCVERVGYVSCSCNKFG